MAADPIQALRRGLFAAALALTAALPAMAASPTVDITVVPVPDTVSYSRPPALTTRAAYEVRVVNRSTNTINSVQLLGTTQVVGAGGTAPFTEAVGAACSPTNAARTAISCALGQLRGGGGATATSSFVLIFDAPPAGTSIRLDWTVSYGEGMGDSTGASHVDTQNGQAVTLLGTPTATDLRSYVPTGGATLFTGVTGIATSADPWTTTITVPAFAKAEVLEDLDAASCSPNYLICVRSTLTIPGSFNFLLIKLRRDVSTLTPRARIENAVLRYAPDASTTPVDIVPCGANDAIPAGQKRCLLYRLVYTKKNSPTADYVGDWEFGIKALENGRISW